MNNYQQLQTINKKLPIVTIRNSLISILLSIVIIIFNLTRTALTSNIFGIDSLGLLTIVIAILPYINTGHNSLISVSAAKLYQPVYNQDHLKTNQVIAELKSQYYMFGSFYLIITIVLAFAFPFIASNNGNIVIDNHLSNNITIIPWYESSLFILSNAIELIATYFIIPISIILLYISNKSYIYNSINIGLTIVFNVVIIVLFVLINNHQIELSFIEMNIIVFCLLGIKSVILLFILFPIRKKLFSWYKFKWLAIKKWKLMNHSWQSMLSGYFNQFSSDIIGIIFLIYASLSPIDNPLMKHGAHGSGMENNFIPSSIFTIFLMILTNINEIVHCITDEAIPSIAEHATFNNQKINKHFFHRYQVLSLFIAIFTSSSYLLIAGPLQAIFLDNDGVHFINTNILNMMVFLMWIPVIVDIFNNMYLHLLSILKKFKQILIIAIIKASVNLIILVIVCAITFSVANHDQWIYIIFSSIIISNLIANCIVYWCTKYYAKSFIINDGCINICKSTILSFLYLFLVCIIMLAINLTCSENIINIIDNNPKSLIIVICAIILIINFIVNLINIYIFRHDDAKFYLDEIKCQWFGCTAHKLSRL